MKSLSECSVLVVDDAPENLLILSGILDGMCNVKGASTGLEALGTSSNIPPDLILLDILMPGMDGFATCQRLKENPATADIPVIFITSLAEQEDKILGFENGAVDFITRPFDAGEVRSRVSTHLRLHMLEKEHKIRIGNLSEALEASEETYRFFAEHTDDILIQLDSSRKITMVNRGWKELTGKDRGLVLGKTLAEVSIPEDSERIDKSILVAVKASNESLKIEFRLETSSGVRWMRAALRLRYAGSGSLKGLTGVITDIHDLVQQTQDLRNSREAIKASSKEILHLVQTAHRFRTPLQDIAGSLSLLNGMSLDPSAQEHIRNASQGCKCLNEELEKLLDHIRQSTSGVHSSSDPLDIPSLPSDSTRGFDCRVLVVDDSQINLRILEHLAVRVGFQQIDAAASGEEALQLWNQHRHPLVLLDCQMPDMDGYQVCREIRSKADSSRTTIIAVSASALPENVSFCLEAGFDHQMEKPVTIESLRNLLTGFGWPNPN